MEILGAETYVHLKVNDTKLICKVNGVFVGEEGQEISIKFNFKAAYAFNKKTEMRIDYEEDEKADYEEMMETMYI